MSAEAVAAGPATAGPDLVRFSRARYWLARPGVSGLVLVTPAVLLLVVVLIIPIIRFLSLSVANPEIPGLLPRTVAALEAWGGRNLPPDSAYSALWEDLAALGGSGEAGTLARRLNFEMPGARTLILSTASRLGPEPADPRAELITLDRRWGESTVWSVLKRESRRLTPFYYLTAAGLRRGANGRVERMPEDQRIFLEVLGRTFMISATTTLLCLVLGYPAAHLLATASPRWAPVLMTMVLLPFWTSTLVRTTAWIVLLQNEGLVNRTLRMLGLIPGSLPLFANRFAVLVAMTHVLLPYMVLPLYGVMKSVPPDLLQAASGLGANPIRAFVRVYMPQTLPGVYAGSILVFVLALGFYVTPALVGGPADQMMSYFVALYTNESLNWGLASALGTILLISAALVYLLALKFGVRIKST
jgi:putative spermidine/putrescine transport system permease protein